MAKEWNEATLRTFAKGISDLMDMLRDGREPQREDFSEGEWRLVELAKILNSRVDAAPMMREAYGPNVVDARRRFRAR